MPFVCHIFPDKLCVLHFAYIVSQLSFCFFLFNSQSHMRNRHTLFTSFVRSSTTYSETSKCYASDYVLLFFVVLVQTNTPEIHMNTLHMHPRRAESNKIKKHRWAAIRTNRMPSSLAMFFIVTRSLDQRHGNCGRRTSACCLTSGRFTPMVFSSWLR